MNFASDNLVGASGPVMDALVAANAGALPAYGDDEITRRVEARLAEIFEHEAAIFLLATGTAANAISAAACVPPWGSLLAYEDAHVAGHECGAPEFFSDGAKIVGFPAIGAKLAPEPLAAYLETLPGAVWQVQPKALSISQVTECGTVYDLAEIAALGEICRRHGLAYHMDGARFANALVALDATPAEMTWKAGIDILSFGGTKNGCLSAEAIVVFRTDLAETVALRRKRGGHLLSKGRLLAAQFDAYLTDDHWLANARHANAMAGRLAAGFEAAGLRLAWPAEANEVFPIMPRATEAALRAGGVGFHPWSPAGLPAGESLGPDELVARFVCSFATDEGMVDRAIALAREAPRRVAA